MKEVIDYYKTLANYLFAVGGGLASIVIALSAYFWTANPPLPLDNRFLAVAVVLVVASLFFCGDVIWLSCINELPTDLRQRFRSVATAFSNAPQSAF